MRCYALATAPPRWRTKQGRRQRDHPPRHCVRDRGMTPMSHQEDIRRAERTRRRLTPETMTPEQRVSYEQRKAARETPEVRAELERDLEAIRHEFPPLIADEPLLGVLEAL